MKHELIKTIMKICKHQFPLIGATAIITNNKKQVLLSKRKNHGLFYPGYWNLPGGLIELNEKVTQGLKREVKEEIGVQIKITKYTGKYYEKVIEKKKKIYETITLPFYAKITKGTPKPLDETTEVKWFNPKEIKKMKLAYNHKEILKDEKII